MGFLEAIRIRNTTNKYYDFKFHASLHKAEMASLDEVLGVDLVEESAFDERTEAEMDKIALKLLEQKRAKLKNV